MVLFPWVIGELQVFPLRQPRDQAVQEGYCLVRRAIGEAQPQVGIDKGGIIWFLSAWCRDPAIGDARSTLSFSFLRTLPR